MSDAEPREPQEGEEAALDGVEPDEALVEAADLLEHEAAPEEAVSAEDVALAEAFSVTAMQVTLPEQGPEPEPSRLEALLGGVTSRMPALVVPVSVEAVILTTLVSIGFLAFVLIEPTPLIRFSTSSTRVPA